MVHFAQSGLGFRGGSFYHKKATRRDLSVSHDYDGQGLTILAEVSTSDRHVVRGPVLGTPPPLVINLRRGHVPVAE